MEYRFRHLEYQSLKGKIGEYLAKSFIRNQLIPRLMGDEGWSHVLLINKEYKIHKHDRKLFRFDNYREDFYGFGFYPTLKLLSKYAAVIDALFHHHCTPDGLLLKLLEVGEIKRLRGVHLNSAVGKRAYPSKTRGSVCELPAVDGALEVVEIKCGRHAKLLDKQRTTYNNLIASGTPLRLINIRIVSFDLNRFLVEEHRYERFV